MKERLGRKRMKKKWHKLLWNMLFVIMIMGCGKGQLEVVNVDSEGIPIYHRETKVVTLQEEANPYFMKFCEDSFFFFSMKEEELESGGIREEAKSEGRKTTEKSTESCLIYQFYKQSYGEENAVPFCSCEEGYVKDYVYVNKAGKEGLAVLVMGEQAAILEYNVDGDIIHRSTLDASLNNPESFPKLTTLKDNEYLITVKESIYHLDGEGQIIGVIRAEGTIVKIVETSDGELYFWEEYTTGKQTEHRWNHLFLREKAYETIKQLPVDTYDLFPFENGVAVVTKDYVVSMEDYKQSMLLDLNIQSILGSQITMITGDQKEIRLAMLDQTVQKPSVYYVSLKDESNNTLQWLQEDHLNEGEYTEDGRKILHVTIPKSCVYQVEFHAKQYNKSSDEYFVEVDRITENLEDYLGKGNRPDIVMFRDHTELATYVEKGLLEDLIPIYQKQEKYSLNDMLPKVKEILGVNRPGSLYAMGGRFQLLLRSSDGTECFRNGKATFTEYLDWYESLLTEKQILGMGDTKLLFYPVLAEFYDIQSSTASFTSQQFKTILEHYKEMYDRHQGELDIQAIQADYGDLTVSLTKGPRWEYYYGTQTLTEPSGSLQGLCGIDGTAYIYMRVNFPMSILTSTSNPEGAFDFLMYYNTQEEWLLKGDTEGSYGKCGNTYGYFHVFEKYLSSEIYESEKPLVSYSGLECYFTEEQKEHLRNMLGTVTSDTMIQRHVYEMFSEELDAYLANQRSLDKVCEILQNRVEIYLAE